MPALSTADAFASGAASAASTSTSTTGAESVGATADPGLRLVRVGLLGLGHVGQAVARLAPHAHRLKDAGFRFRIAGALVRDIDRPRRCIKPARLTTNPSAFLRGNYDVVIEALSGVEPARSIVTRLLGRGIPVVTANKALVAAHSRELTALAARRKTTFRYEASALAGVPFLGTFAGRPLVSDVNEFVAVVNGTSNFILSRMQRDDVTFDEALRDAQTLGLTEPDASRDVDGVDAGEKLALLASIFGWGTLPPHRLGVQSIRGITPRDLHVARTLNATIKPVIAATRSAHGVGAWVGPALVSRNHALAPLNDALCGIQLKGAFVSDLFFSGPGAGPDVTAATLLDDAVEAVTTTTSAPRERGGVPRIATLAAPPNTRWLVRADFPGYVPDVDSVAQLFRAHNLDTSFVSDAIDNSRWADVAPISAESLRAALARIAGTHRVQSFAIRIL